MGRKKKLTEDLIKAICDLYDTDPKITPALIKQELGSVSMSLIYQALRTTGRSRSKGQIYKPTLSQEDQEAIIEGYLNGASTKSLRDQYHITNNQIYAILNASNLDPSERIKRRTESRHRQLDNAVAYYLDNKPLWFIYKETKISPATLHNELRKRSIELRRGKLRRCGDSSEVEGAAEV